LKRSFGIFLFGLVLGGLAGYDQKSFELNAVSGAVLGWWKKDPAAAETYALAQVGTPLAEQLVPNLAIQNGESRRRESDRLGRQFAGFRIAKTGLRHAGLTIRF
jgi:hypothetical protein